MKVIRDFASSSVYWSQVISLDQNEMQYPWKPDQWKNLDGNLDVLFLKLNQQDLIGFALYKLSPIENLAHLLKVVQAPSNRGSGLAKKFFAEQETWLCAEHYERIYLEVSTSNVAATKFYQKLGFQTLRRVSHFYQDGEDAWTMEKRLESSI